MAAGDNSNFATLSTGEGITFDVDSANASLITAFASGKAASVAITRETFDGTTLTTATRSLACIFGGAEAITTTLLSDTFTEAIDTALASHTPDTDTAGNGWVETDGGWSVIGATDLLETTASAPSGTYYIATIDTGESDWVATLRVDPNSVAGDFGFICAYQDATNWVAVRINHAFTAGGVQVIKCVSGTVTSVAAGSLPLNPSDAVDLTITKAGTGYTVVAERVGTSDVGNITTTVSEFSASTVQGLYADAAGAQFDTLEISQTSGARITVYPDEPIFDDDTGIAITADAGLVTDGTVSSAAISAQSVTNTSAKDYEVPYLMPMSEPRVRHTAAFTVDCFAAGFVSFDDPGEIGIDTVTVEVTDSGATSTGEVAASFMPADALGTYGRESQYPRWRATIDPTTDFGGASAKGIATVTVKAYPKDGDTAVSMSYFVYLDPADAYDTHFAQMDTRMELPLASAVAGSFRQWAKITGGTSGATAVVIGAKDASTLYITSLSDEGYSTNKWPQFNASETISSDIKSMSISGLSAAIPDGARVTDASSNAAYVQGDHSAGAATLYYLPVSSNLDSSGTLTFEYPDYAAKGMTTAAATANGVTSSGPTATTNGQESPSNGRSWDGGTVDDPDDPFFYPGTAMEALEAASSDGKASFSELRYVTCGVIPGNYRDYGGADTTPDTTDGAITITAADGHSPKLVKSSYYSAYGWHTAHTRMVGISAWRSVNTPLQNEGPHTTSDGPTFGAVSCDLYCTNDRNGQALWTYLRDCLVGNSRASGIQSNAVIDCGIYALGNDIFSANVSSNLIAINNAGKVAEVSPNHQSTLQLGGNFSNCGLILNRITGSATAGWYTRQDDTDYTFSAMLALWNEYADDNDATRRESAVEGLMEYCNTTYSAAAFPQYADTGTDWSHVSHYHIGNLRTDSDWGPAAFQSNGYFVRYENDPDESAGWSGATNTAEVFADSVVNAAGYDFAPTASTPTMPRISTIGPNGSTLGDTIYIGANPASALAISSRDPTSIAKGATVDITVTGTGFIDGIAATSNDAGAFTVNSTTWHSSTEVVVNITGGSGAAGNYVDAITLTNPDGQSVSFDFTLTAGFGKIENMSSTAISGYVRFEGDRDTDWRGTGGTKDYYGLDDTARCRVQWQWDEDGSFSSPREEIRNAVGDSRGWTYYPEGDTPLTGAYEVDPKETLLIAGVPHNTTIYARCRYVTLDANGDVDETGPWSDSDSATRNASIDPSWVNQQIPDGQAPGYDSPSSNLGETWMLFEILTGGSNEGATAEEQLGINLTYSSGNDSYWEGMRSLMDDALTVAGDWSHRCGFFVRAWAGVHKVLTSASTSTEFYDLGGGRNVDISDPDSTGFFTSPAMLNPLQAYEHIRNLSAGTVKTRMLSVVDDLDELDGIGVPVVLYHSLYAAGHIAHYSATPTAQNILNAHGLTRVLQKGFYLAIDVLCNAAIEDPDRPSGTASPEADAAEAMQSYGRQFFAERFIKQANAQWPEARLTYPLMGDVAACSLALDETAYASAKTLGTPLDLRNYLAAVTDQGAMSLSNRNILRINTSTSSWVAAGSDNEEKCQRALDVVVDVWYTWGGLVLPTVLNQSIWPDMNPDHLDAAMRRIQSIVRDRAGVGKPRARRESRSAMPRRIV